jgi:hypothetical protein
MTSVLQVAATVSAAVVVGLTTAYAVTQKPRASRTYTCRASAVYELKDDGSLQRLDTFLMNWDSPFEVDRATGLSSGGAGENTTYPIKEVIFTPPGNLFYVVSKSGGSNRSVKLLSIRDYASGPRKPFMLMDSSWVFSGVCE